MSGNAVLDPVGRTITLTVPIRFQRRGGRKLVLAPAGVTDAPPRAQSDNTLVKALARAHRWRCVLESGAFNSIGDLARAERVTKSYVCRILRLTLLSPTITESILDGRQGAMLQLAALMEPFPVDWLKQAYLLDNQQG